MVGRAGQGTGRTERLKQLREELLPKLQMPQQEACAGRAVGTGRLHQ